ncbi:glycosyltransferase [Orenia metallireducens]|uniref:glycosyltransferase n=1 Tax=Orenia metallireducens TaxID=1413210 RepID=UPI0009F3A013|nr:glycosyltransferase [Orenia metallireducens]
MKIKILTLGTRGDVQPYIPLAIGLQDKGHDVTLCTAKNFENLVRKYKIPFYPIRVDYQELIQSEEGKKMLSGNPIEIIRNMKSLVFPLIKQSLKDLWSASKDAELIIYHPKAFGAYDIVEKLEIPAMIAFPIPALTPTAEFSNPIFPFEIPLNLGLLNKFTYAINRFTTIPFHGIVNQWRKEELNLPRKSIFRNDVILNGKPIPIIYCCSPKVIRPPADWDSCNVCISGYWFLEEGNKWEAPKELLEFLKEGQPPLCISFSSLTLKEPKKFKEILLEALKKTKERAIILTGWSGLKFKNLSSDIFVLDYIPITGYFLNVLL